MFVRLTFTSTDESWSHRAEEGYNLKVTLLVVDIAEATHLEFYHRGIPYYTSPFHSKPNVSILYFI